MKKYSRVLAGILAVLLSAGCMKQHFDDREKLREIFSTQQS